MLRLVPFLGLGAGTGRESSPKCESIDIRLSVIAVRFSTAAGRRSGGNDPEWGRPSTFFKTGSPSRNMGGGGSTNFAPKT